MLLDIWAHASWEGNGRAPSMTTAHAAEMRGKVGGMGSDGESPSLLASALELKSSSGADSYWRFLS